MSRYNHTIDFHNLTAPGEIVPVIMQLLKPASVVDIGCGLGTFLRTFKENGVKTIKGLDGKWCKKELLFQNILPEEFTELELEQPISIPEKYDLAVCLEVAEHISEQRAAGFVKDLTKLSDTVLFSAAIPLQGGDHHLNEQWLDYWEAHFLSNGFQKFDVLKPFFWENKKIFWWYKQNMVLFIKKGIESNAITELPKNVLQNQIHPELFLTVTDYHEKNAWKRALRMFYKAILFKAGIKQ